MSYLGLIELEDIRGEFHVFELMQEEHKLFFGSSCNMGFLPHGEWLIDDCFSIDENLQEMVGNLQTMVDDGEQYTVDELVIY